MEVMSNSKSDFLAAYNRKDLILYALSIGFQKTNTDLDSEDELRFLYELHPKFAAVPTFCLALTFWAKECSGQKRNYGGTTASKIPPFPPPTMSKQGAIPREFIIREQQSDILDVSTFPLIHMWQSIVWHQDLPIPAHTSFKDDVVRTKLNGRTIAVIPKSIGTFVTSETTVRLDDTSSPQHGIVKSPKVICTMQSTVLVLGIAKENVISYDSGTALLSSSKKTIIPKDQRPILESTFKTAPTQALLYRLASGDSNHIHVDTSVSDELGSSRPAPLLHGLCTLGIAYRTILGLVNKSSSSSNEKNYTIRKLEAKFTRPVFVGDELCVKIWDAPAASTENNDQAKKRYLFVVINNGTGKTVVDRGFAEFVEVSTNLSSKL